MNFDFLEVPDGIGLLGNKIFLGRDPDKPIYPRLQTLDRARSRSKDLVPRASPFRCRRSLSDDRSTEPRRRKGVMVAGRRVMWDVLTLLASCSRAVTPNPIYRHHIVQQIYIHVENR